MPTDLFLFRIGLLPFPTIRLTEIGVKSVVLKEFLNVFEGTTCAQGRFFLICGKLRSTLVVTSSVCVNEFATVVMVVQAKKPTSFYSLRDCPSRLINMQSTFSGGFTASF